MSKSDEKIEIRDNQPGGGAGKSPDEKRSRAEESLDPPTQLEPEFADLEELL